MSRKKGWGRSFTAGVISLLTICVAAAIGFPTFFLVGRASGLAMFAVAASVMAWTIALFPARLHDGPVSGTKNLVGRISLATIPPPMAIAYIYYYGKAGEAFELGIAAVVGLIGTAIIIVLSLLAEHSEN